MDLKDLPKRRYQTTLRCVTTQKTEDFTNSHYFDSHIPTRNELSVIYRKEENQLEAAQMRFLRSFQGHKKGEKQRNVDIRNKLNQDNIVDEIRKYQQSLFQHVKRMGNIRLPKVTLQCQPHGKRHRGRPR
jgi:hypothetical protein